MKNSIIYLFVILAAITACSDSMELDTEKYYPSLEYAFIEQADFIFPKSASSYQTKVESSCDWRCVSDCDWISIEKSVDGKSITISVAENKVSPTRSGKILFYNEDRLLSSSSVVQAPAMSANCYMISKAGTYAFSAVKGNTEESLEAIESVDVLWETYGTAGTPEKGSLIKSATYQNGLISFTTSDKFREGNAVIAAKDGNGKILWSWHIWLTDQPQEQVYYNNAGTLMDRNLGATSATPGDVGALGLMYQWGRKDPFPGPGILGSITASKESSIYQDMTQSYCFNPNQKSITGFNTVQNISTGTEGDIAYSVAHPTTNIHYNTAGNVGATNTWLYSIDQSDALRLWRSKGATDKSGKTNYDPCPPGYIVPVNNYGWNSATDNPMWTNNIIWETNGLSGFIYNQSETNKTYYPAVGYRAAGQLKNVGFACYYWTGDAFMESGALLARGLGHETRSKINVGTKLQTQYALPIRCMKQ